MRSLSGVGDRAGQQKFDQFGKHRHWYCSGCTFKIAGQLIFIFLSHAYAIKGLKCYLQNKCFWFKLGVQYMLTQSIQCVGAARQTSLCNQHSTSLLWPPLMFVIIVNTLKHCYCECYSEVKNTCCSMYMQIANLSAHVLVCTGVHEFCTLRGLITQCLEIVGNCLKDHSHCTFSTHFIQYNVHLLCSHQN